MNSVPAWLSYASAGMALLALIISIRTYNRAGPRVKVSVTHPQKWVRTDSALNITVKAINSGLAPVQIVSIRAQFIYFAISNVTPTLDLKSNRITGPITPITLNNGHQETWDYDALSALHQAFNADSLRSHFLNYGIDLYTVTNSQFISFAIRTATKSIFLMFRNGFIPGLYIVADLGNGVQVRSRPMPRIGYQLFRLAIESVASDPKH